ncbi:MAG: HAL/PAL/TAL family ammonia-lyase [Janthinobacterium lividum]
MMPAMPEIGGPVSLTARRLTEAARGSQAVRLHPEALERIRASHGVLVRLASSGARIYGVTTGLGAVVDTKLDAADADVQRRVVMARAVGVGTIATDEQVRAIMLARLAGFAVGTSGVSVAVVEAYLALLNAGIHPQVPLTGSLGEADLLPLAHIASVLLGGGRARLGGEILSGADALARAGLAPPKLGLKDGLALVSSNAASIGLGALVVADAERTLAAIVAGASLSFEGQRANLSPLRADVVALHPVPGQAEIAGEMLGLLQGGALDQPDVARLLHDPLSFRCAPSVLGCALDAIRSATRAVELALAMSDDNPAVLVDPDRVVGTASFDTTHLTLAFETLGLALSRAAALTGARIMQSMSSGNSGLPRFLTPRPNGRSGLAPLQKTVASLVAGIGHDAMPMAAWVMPVADGLEDYATMAVPVVQKTGTIVERLQLLAAAELMTAAQAIDLQPDLVLGDGSTFHRTLVRALTAFLDEDRSLAGDLDALHDAIRTDAFDGVRTRLFVPAPTSPLTAQPAVTLRTLSGNRGCT